MRDPRSDGGAARPAVFLDRDGTVIVHVHYLADPAEVRLIPGGGEALRRLKAEGFAAGRRDQPVGDRPGDAQRRGPGAGQRRDGPPARPRRGGDRRLISLPGSTARRRPDGRHPRRPQAGRRHADPGRDRPRGRPGRLVHGRRHDQRRPRRDQRRLPAEHHGPDRQADFRRRGRRGGGLRRRRRPGRGRRPYPRIRRPKERDEDPPHRRRRVHRERLPPLAPQARP